ncbi:MAG TPA: Ig-like domain-containing protein [Clostridiales bacterium]|nr:Ig-like domain-containing protein [Clostridiales bacterium]
MPGRNHRKRSLIINLMIITYIFTIVFQIQVYTIGESIKTEAEICAILGVLKGDGKGITQEYLGKRTERLQAVILTLRLFGRNYEQEALEYNMNNNFIDADDITWQEGINVLAYIKANDQFGWHGGIDGKFNPRGLVTPQMFYKILLEALGYRQDYGNSKDFDFKWEEVMKFAFKVGLWDIADKEVLKNEDIAVAIVEALQLKMKNSDRTLLEKLMDEGAIEKEKAIEVGLLSISPQITSIKEIDLGVINIGDEVKLPQTVTATFSDESQKEVPVNWETAIENLKEGRRTIVGEVQGTEIRAFANITFISLPLEVKDVCADNLIEVNIVLNKAVDVNKVKNKNNYSIIADGNKAEINDIRVSQDRKIVTLCLVNPVQQQKRVEVTVKKEVGLEQDIKKTIDSIIDTKLPEVTELTVLGNKKIRIVYSEPVQNAEQSSSYSIDDSTLYGYVTKIDRKTLLLNITNPLSIGTHYLRINKSVYDYSNYPIMQEPIEFKVYQDNSLPEIEKIISATQTKVKIRFNKPVEPIVKEKIVTVHAAEVISVTADDDFKTYTIEFERTSALAEQGTDVYFYDVTDYYGNKNTIKVYITPSIDKETPGFSGYTIKDQNKIILEFTKDVVPTGALYILKKISGETVPLTQIGWYIDEAGNIIRNKVVLQKQGDSLFEPGTYNLSIQDVVDYTPQENRIVPLTIDISIIDDISPEIKYVRMKDNRLFILFNEKVDRITALSSENYRYLNFSNYVSEKLPEGTVIELLSDYRTVVISLPEKFNMNDINVLQISAVKDEAGNVMVAKGIIAPFEKVESPSRVLYAYITGRNTIELILSKDINGETLTAADFIITAGTETLSISSAEYDAGNKKITLYVNDHISSNGQFGGKNVTVHTALKDIKTSDVYGQPIQGLGLTTAVDKYPPYVTGMSVLNVNSNTNIIITLNENIKTANGSGKSLSSSELGQFIVLVNNTVNQVIESRYEAATNTGAARIILTISGNQVGKNIRVLFFAGPNNTLTDYAAIPNSLENFELK